MPGVFCDHRQVVNGRGRGNGGVLEPCVDAAADRAIEKPPGFKCNGDGQRQKARLVEFYDRVEPVRQISRTPARVLTLKPRNAGLDFSQRDDRAKQVVAVRAYPALETGAAGRQPFGIGAGRDERNRVGIEKIALHYSQESSRMIRAERRFGRSSGSSAGTASSKSAKEGNLFISLSHCL